MKYFIGTLIFASSSALFGLFIRPKDNIENLFYVMIYLKNSTLTWLKFKKENKKEFLETILKLHYNITEDEFFNGFSKELKFIFKSLKNLKQKKIQNMKYIYKTLNNYKINQEDLSKVSFLKQGYPLNIAKFLNIFNK